MSIEPLVVHAKKRNRIRLVVGLTPTKARLQDVRELVAHVLCLDKGAVNALQSEQRRQQHQVLAPRGSRGAQLAARIKEQVGPAVEQAVVHGEWERLEAGEKQMAIDPRVFERVKPISLDHHDRDD